MTTATKAAHTQITNFLAALPSALAGKDNAGLRAKLRAQALAWEAGEVCCDTLEQAIGLTCSTVALTAQGRAAVESALANAKPA